MARSCRSRLVLIDLDVENKKSAGIKIDSVASGANCSWANHYHEAWGNAQMKEGKVSKPCPLASYHLPAA